MANVLTSCRIIFSILMIFFPVFSIWFYSLYILCGITDMVDGTVARKINADTAFGAKFDTAADFVFVVASLVKILPAIHIPIWLWLWISVIAIIKVINCISGFIFKKRIVVEHTVMNKITGLLLFILPLTLPVIRLECSVVVVCCIATFAAIQEGHFIRTGREVE